MNALHDNEPARKTAGDDIDTPVADYLRERPALVLTMLDLAERYARPAKQDVDYGTHS